MYILVWTRYIEELQRLSTRELQFDPIKRNTLTLTITIVNYQTRPNVYVKFQENPEMTIKSDCFL